MWAGQEAGPASLVKPPSHITNLERWVSPLAQVTILVGLTYITAWCVRAQSKLQARFTLTVPKEEATKSVTPKFQTFVQPLILKIQRLEGKQCRSRWGGSLRATSFESIQFAKSNIFILFFFLRLTIARWARLPSSWQSRSYHSKLAARWAGTPVWTFARISL